MNRIFRVTIIVSLAVALLAYLRDPPWILSYVHGLGSWEFDSERTRVRWMTGHAAFHVPSELQGVVVPLRFEKEPSDWPRIALVTVDDQPAERLTFADDSWRYVTVRLPPKGSRRARRIDIKLDRVSPGNRGLQLGELQYVR